MLRTFLALPTAVMTLILSLSLPAPASADLAPVTSRANFENLISDRELRRFGIRVQVTPAGQIAGRAFGSSVEGEWTWQDGYFCRDILWGGESIGYNCQLVSLQGNTIRFTSDRGAGDYADFTLQ